MGDAAYFALFIAAGVIGGSLLLGPVGVAVGRLLGVRRESKSGLSTGEMAAQRVVELEARVAELEENQARVLELEERVDFAERLLSAADSRAIERGVESPSPTPR